jgi:hypothetical protein
MSLPSSYTGVAAILDFLQKKRKIVIMNSQHHGSLLMKAVFWGRLDVVKFLLDEGGVDLSPQPIGRGEKVMHPLQWGKKTLQWMIRYQDVSELICRAPT